MSSHNPNTDKGVDTKREQLFNKTCPHCGMGFYLDGTQRKRRYCSDKCKQAAYRDRHYWERERAKRLAEVNKPDIEQIPVRDRGIESLMEEWSKIDGLEGGQEG